MTVLWISWHQLVFNVLLGRKITAKSPAQTHGFPQLLRCPGAGHAGSGHRSSAGAVPIASDPAWGLSSIRYLTDEWNGRSKSSCLRSVPTCLTRRWTCGCFLTSIVQFFKNSWFAMTILTVPVKSLQIKAKNLLAVVSRRCLTWLLEHLVTLSRPVSIPGGCACPLGAGGSLSWSILPRARLESASHERRMSWFW